MKLLRTLAPLIAVVSTITAVPASAGTTTITTTVRIAPPPRARPWYYPLLLLSPRVYHRFEYCVLPGQSRSTFAHPNLGDNVNDGGSSGIFQMEPVLWNRWAPAAGVHAKLWLATPYQQSLVAAVVYRHDGFEPWSGC